MPNQNFNYTDNCLWFHCYVGIKDRIKVYEDTARAIDSGDKVKESKLICNKDTGEKETLQRWTRGLWFSVSGGGHIHCWQPLYK